MPRPTRCALTLAMLLLPALAHAQSLCRLYVASQYDWGAKRGFYLDFEGSTLSSLPVILGVGDGANWRFPLYSPGFAFDQDYQIRAIIAPDTAQLFLDGVKVADSPGTWLPASGPLVVYERPSWASETGDWMADLHTAAVSVARAGVEVERHVFDFTGASARPVPVQLFEPMSPTSAPLGTLPGDAVTIDVSLRFASSALDPWKPFIDRFEQCRYADWPEKVTSEADLVADIAAEDAILETMPPSPDFDEYGGYTQAGWGEEPSGYFRLARRDGYWWLITPLGNPCFYIGVSTFPAQTWDMTPVTGRASLFQQLPPAGQPSASAWGHDAWGVGEDVDYFCFHSWNLARKYGDTWWTDAQARAIDRLRHWGFSGGAKWGAPDTLVSTPVLGRGGVPNLAGHPDVFDPAVQTILRQVLESQIAPRRDDPHILGWSVGSEKAELIFPEEITAIMALPGTTPGKRAILDYAVDQLYGGSVPALAAAWAMAVTTRAGLYDATPTPTAADLEAMRRFYADSYYGFCYRTVKETDPNHLYLGCYLCPVCDVAEANWRLIAAHCDVVSYDFYRSAYDNDRLRRLEAETDKPVFCGEFSFPAWYDGWRGFGRYGVYASSDAEAGEMYYRFTQAAAQDPYCIGQAWFQYHDQPLTGRGPGTGPNLVYGEHYAFGLVTVTDRPKWDQVRRMREANLQAAQWRAQSPKGPFDDVPPTFWAAAEITACVGAGAVAGYPDHTYRPGLAVTRDQMAVYVARALAGGEAGVPAGPTTPTFSDVATDHWAYDHVEYAYANAVVAGYGDGTYRPATRVDRGQMAVFVARSLVAPSGDAAVPDPEPPDTFPDVTAQNEWAWCRKHVECIADRGVTQGYPDGRYHPEYVCTRDQMAVYVARAFGWL
jgi:hypothetical protein